MSGIIWTGASTNSKPESCSSLRPSPQLLPFAQAPPLTLGPTLSQARSSPALR